jgi:DNA-binding transcriptional ArsR family regulator
MNLRSASELRALRASAGEAADFLLLLANEKRLLVLCELMATVEMSVNDLAHAVGLSQSALSQHLAKLRAEGLVCTRREAQTIYYRISKDPRNRQILTLLRQLFRQ